MTTLRLYRGIAVPATSVADVASSIRRTGLIEGQGHWRIEQLWKLPSGVPVEQVDLSSADIGEADWRSAVCACGTLDGAAYYAWKHNRNETNDTPILIEFEADVDQVRIDGRDFLYPAFQGGHPERARGLLEQLYGSSVLRYADLAWTSPDQRMRVSLCHLATLDPEVVLAHYANLTVVEGKHGTTFENAFTVAYPVSPNAIVRVWVPEVMGEQRTPSVTVKDVVVIQPSQMPETHQEREPKPETSLFDMWRFKYKD